MIKLEACPICASDKIDHAYDGRTTRNRHDEALWPVYKCRTCSHGFMNPQPSWEELAGYYSAEYDPYAADHGSQAKQDAETVAIARKEGSFRHLRLPTGKRLLDVGCGGGWFLRIARQLGAETFGIEPSVHGAEQTRRSGIEVFNGTMETYLSENGDTRKFDIITANHVIEHAPDPVATFRQITRLLLPGGLIWISVPNARSYFSRTLGDRWHSTDLPFHLQQFSLLSLETAARKARLNVMRQYTYSLPGATADSLRHVLRHKYWIPQRFTERVGYLNGRIAQRLAERLDRHQDGEAIIGEYRTA
jgi:2-polyprenyl-3-methyl-5-hydroxy-6-metoxy-1,4-benzoquinol methylase